MGYPRGTLWLALGGVPVMPLAHHCAKQISRPCTVSHQMTPSAERERISPTIRNQIQRRKGKAGASWVGAAKPERPASETEAHFTKLICLPVSISESEVEPGPQ
ncbi:hypothetical protein NDU88_000212 [Pleurodeles waltl]|uniref:Secreted protein n=1 Tax=Pleurodeles waltl TaxID=8319 RepID=A0AAV7MR84_PLEWA|nr:hypothetical protein NDU88_000212 [Pleurodeles waltl]